MDTSTMKAQFEQAHETAWNAVSEDESLPKIDILVIVSFFSEIVASSGSGRYRIIKKYVDKYGPVFKTYAEILSEEFLTGLVQEALEKSDREEFQNMAKDDVARCLVQTSKAILLLVAAYFKKEITDIELLTLLSRTGIEELGVKTIKAFGIEVPPEMILQFAGPILAYQGSIGAYKEYKKALEDLRIARERRIQVEAACQKSIEMIRTYREQAERYVSAYMNEHLDTIEHGLDTMNQAILENDVDGYMSGNVEIQKLLGSQIQFTNQDEFEAFMESDEPFIF